MVHGRLGTANSDTLYASGGGVGTHQLWGLGGDDILDTRTTSNGRVLSTYDELYGDRVPRPGDIQYDPNQIPPGQPGNDLLLSGEGNDRLYGDDGRDWLYGQGGDDILDGGRGNDYLDGYSGGGLGTDRDTLIGGEGADTFGLGYRSSGAYYLGSGYATVLDFEDLEGDNFRVYGSQSNYRLDYSQNFSGSTALDTGIYYRSDLISVVQDTTNIYLSDNFIFSI